MSIRMLPLHSAIVLPFPASTRARGADHVHERAMRGEAMGDAAYDNVVPLRGNVVVLADSVRRGMRPAGSVGLVPPPGGEAA
jgi:hypothetical protein